MLRLILTSRLIRLQPNAKQVANDVFVVMNLRRQLGSDRGGKLVSNREQPLPQRRNAVLGHVGQEHVGPGD